MYDLCNVCRQGMTDMFLGVIPSFLSIFCGMVAWFAGTIFNAIRYTLKFDCPSHVFRFRMVPGLVLPWMNVNLGWIKTSRGVFLVSCSGGHYVMVWSISNSCLVNFLIICSGGITQKRSRESDLVGNRIPTDVFSGTNVAQMSSIFRLTGLTFSTFGCRETYLCPSLIVKISSIPHNGDWNQHVHVKTFNKNPVAAFATLNRYNYIKGTQDHQCTIHKPIHFGLS